MKCQFREWDWHDGGPNYKCVGGVHDGFLCENEYPDWFMCDWSESYHIVEVNQMKVDGE